MQHRYIELFLNSSPSPPMGGGGGGGGYSSMGGGGGGFGGGSGGYGESDSFRSQAYLNSKLSPNVDILEVRAVPYNNISLMTICLCSQVAQATTSVEVSLVVEEMVEWDSTVQWEAAVVTTTSNLNNISTLKKHS